MRPGDGRTGLGAASIEAALLQQGIAVQAVSDAVNRDGFQAMAFTDRVLAALRAAGPRPVLGLGAFVWNEPEIQALLRAAQTATDATIVLGGPQVSYVGRGGLEALYPQADWFVRGHGEGAMVALALDSPGSGLGLHRVGTPDLGQRADLALASLPSPYLTGVLPVGRNLRWETQRGCPYRCTFCQHREPGSRLRNQSLSRDRFGSEARLFAASAQRISVLDPIFHANRSRAVTLLGDVRRAGLTARLSLQCRFELIEQDFLEALEGLDVTLEFGLQTAITSESIIIRRPNRLERVSRVIDQLLERGLDFEVSLIYGLPTQTLDSFRESVDWCLERGVPRIRAWPLMLLRGTPLAVQADRWGLVESSLRRIPIVVASHSFTREDHKQMALLARQLETMPRPGDAGILERSA
jgi:radical SAM superfamily enzyme YgiQ (UPF0313 family)